MQYEVHSIKNTHNPQWNSVWFLYTFEYLFPLFSPVSHREEICTLSRQASFRRMNSISTDTRGAVILLNNSAASSCVFSYFVMTWFGLMCHSHLFRVSLSKCVAMMNTLYCALSPRVSASCGCQGTEWGGRFERAWYVLHYLESHSWSFPLFLLSADRGKHPAEGGGNPKDQPVFPRGQSTYVSYSAWARAKAKASHWGCTVDMSDDKVLSFNIWNLNPVHLRDW